MAELLMQVIPQFANVFGNSGTGQNRQFSNLDFNALNSALGSTYGPGASAFNEGLATGYVPDLTQQLEAQLMPALERSYSRGSAAVNQAAADRGTLTSTGTVADTSDLRGALESGLLEQLAGAQTQLALGGQQARTQLAGQSSNQLMQALAQFFQQSQFASSQPLNAIAALSAGAGAGMGTASQSRSKTDAGSGQCWVARAIYGAADVRWLLARHYVLYLAPTWFHNAYVRYGERVAAVCGRSKLLRAVLRPLFDHFVRRAAYALAV